MTNAKLRKKQVQELKQNLSEEITINIEEDINDSFDETLMEGLVLKFPSAPKKVKKYLDI